MLAPGIPSLGGHHGFGLEHVYLNTLLGNSAQN